MRQTITVAPLAKAANMIKARKCAEEELKKSKRAEAVAIGLILRGFRESNQVSLRAVARHAVSAMFLSDVERGKRNASMDLLEAYASMGHLI